MVCPSWIDHYLLNKYEKTLQVQKEECMTAFLPMHKTIQHLPKQMNRNVKHEFLHRMHNVEQSSSRKKEFTRAIVY